MTIICAYRDSKAGKTWLGSNSRALVGDTIISGDLSKWSFYGDWAIAFSGRGITTDVIAADEKQFPKKSDSIHEVVAFIRKSLRAADIGKEDEEGAMDFATSGLIVHSDGRIYDVDGHLSVAPINADALWACGSGMEYALGAAHVLAGHGLSIREIVLKSLEAAISLDSGCPGTPIIEEF